MSFNNNNNNSNNYQYGRVPGRGPGPSTGTRGFSRMAPQPQGPTIGDPKGYDGKRVRKAIQRRTIDYNSDVIRYFQVIYFVVFLMISIVMLLKVLEI